MADWLERTFLLLPFLIWLFFGVGLPWALALLARDEWGDRVTVIALSLALGPLGLTAVMFLLGTFASLTIELTMAGSAALAAVGAAIAWWRYERGDFTPHVGGYYRQRTEPLNQFELAILVLIGLAIVVNLAVAAYWPFVAYDPLWVFGYNGKIFTMREAIPSEIGYYPQLVPLTFTYLQQAWGEINDHAARAAIPWFHTASILMVYVLGRRAFGRRRVGLLAAATWAFYPHVAAWGGAGDLEIVLAMYLAGAAAFFISAWRAERARDAVIGGVLLAGGLWTKPTAGALALGVILAVAGWAVVVGFRPAATWRKLRIALIMGAASAPIGGMWYIRNLAEGHPAVEFPADYWHGFAQRSGQELGWPVLIGMLVAGGLAWRAIQRSLVLYPRRNPDHVPAYGNKQRVSAPGAGWRARLAVARREIALAVLAVALLLAGTLPSALDLDAISEPDDLWTWARGDLGAARHLGVIEVILLVAGFGLLAWMGRDVWRGWSAERRTTIGLLWALLLPYALLWFWNYSYHYRLSFAIVPLLAVQVAALVEGWLWSALEDSRTGRALGAALLTGVAALGLAAGLEHTAKEWIDGGLDNDAEKYAAANPALMRVVDALADYAEENGPPVVSIPGEDRLPFFFPEWDIRNSRDPDTFPASLDDLDGVDIFVDSSVFEFLLHRHGPWPNPLQADADVGATYHRLDVRGPVGDPWPTVLEPIPLHPDGSVTFDDGNFRYEVFTVHPAARTAPMAPTAPTEAEVLVGDFVEFLGHDVVSLEWVPGEQIALALYWRPTENAPPARDLVVYIQLTRQLTPPEDVPGDEAEDEAAGAEEQVLARWEGVPLQGQYPTRFWQPGESLYDYWLLRVPEDIPPGTAELHIGLLDPEDGVRLGMSVDGRPAVGRLTINSRILVK